MKVDNGVRSLKRRPSSWRKETQTEEISLVTKLLLHGREVPQLLRHYHNILSCSNLCNLWRVSSCNLNVCLDAIKFSLHPLEANVSLVWELHGEERETDANPCMCLNNNKVSIRNFQDTHTLFSSFFNI